MTVPEIVADVDDDFITDLRCEKKVPPLNIISPKLERLWLTNLSDGTQLQRCHTRCRQAAGVTTLSPGVTPGAGRQQVSLRYHQVSHQVQAGSSLSGFTQLKFLHIFKSNLSDSAPKVIGGLTSLTELHLLSCQLQDLPACFDQLNQLKTIHLAKNCFTELPTVVFTLPQLKKIDVRENIDLRMISKQVIKLTNLDTLLCENCPKLVEPPYAVCQQGLFAVRQYFNSLKNKADFVELAVVPVAIVGNSLAGKTSLVKSLQEGKRRFTNRSKQNTSTLEEATKVFEVKDLELPESIAKLVDHGGHEIYHITYQYILKERNIPLFVVNLKEFSEISSSSNREKAAKETCWNWLSHLYLSCPLLGPPLLAITHTEAAPEGKVEEVLENLLDSMEKLKLEMLKEEEEHHGRGKGDFQKILHLSNKATPIFQKTDIFQFSDDPTELSNIKRLKAVIDERCEEFKTTIPQCWNDITKFLSDAHKDSFYIDLSTVERQFPTMECHIVLDYMHNTGDILWFKNVPQLKHCIFHRISLIAEMISLLFHHQSEAQWQDRVGTFTSFKYRDRIIRKEKYKELIKTFITSGILDDALLEHLLSSYHIQFPKEVAVDLLHCFKILHGPINAGMRKSYIVPYFSPKCMSSDWEIGGGIQLRLVMELGGLALPKYGYQLTTAAFLNADAGPCTTMKVVYNGATVYHGASCTHLIHFDKENKMVLQTSTDANVLADSWNRHLKTAQTLVTYVSSIWKACRPSIEIVCSHCLFLRDPNPGTFVDPDWLYPAFTANSDGITEVRLKMETSSFSGTEPVFCSKEYIGETCSKKPEIPKPLVYPCGNLTLEDKQVVEKYLEDNESKCFQRPEGTMHLPASYLHVLLF
ncbi:malignant fibrous histiocytoma-amplified sequence 1 homolog [Watersipora subatra]|uniref:malignant fibrous histiocytoma-amplified sequence 1 homolog n=1 Tax=Watersipora subatra TaxID=2589382 RepID=UPI00355AD4C9